MLVVKACAWKVAGPVAVSKYSVTVIDSPAATARGTASLTTSPRAGISVSGAPAKVSRVDVPADPALAPAIRTGEVPYAWDSRTRTRSPPALSRTT